MPSSIGIGSGIPFLQTGYSSVINPVGLSVLYYMTDASGTNLPDSSGNARNGTLQLFGTGALPTIGPLGLTFAGDPTGTPAAGSRVAVPAVGAPTAWTMTVLLRQDTLTGIQFAYSVNGVAEYIFQAGVMQGICGPSTITTPAFTPTVSTWYVLTFSCSAAGAMSYYVNGALVGTGTFGAAPATLTVGALGCRSNNTFFLTGVMALFYIRSIVETPGDVASNYAGIKSLVLPRGIILP